jgi:hypothetical protein
VRRVVVAWLVVAALAVGSGAVAVVGLNATVFGAAGFVRVYLEAIARGDAAGALGMSGVRVDAEVRDDFLVDDALAGLDALGEFSVASGSGSTEVVTVAWAVGDTESTSRFTVERTGSRLGLFPEWAFAVSPVATLRLTVENDQRFDLNGVAAASGTGSRPVDYAVLTPGVYRVDHHSTFLQAQAADVVVDNPAAAKEATLEVLPTDALRDRVEAEVHEHLTACATQEVLFPTGCPLGRSIPNRVVSTPSWSIVEYPELTLEPGGESGTWVIPPTAATAHLVVDVQSLFDGSVSTFDEDVPFTASYVVTIGADDATLQISPTPAF